MIGWIIARIGSQALSWAILAGAATLSVAGMLLGIRRSGRLAERAEQALKASEVRRDQLDAAAGRPGNRNELGNRLRSGRF